MLDRRRGGVVDDPPLGQRICGRILLYTSKHPLWKTNGARFFSATANDNCLTGFPERGRRSDPAPRSCDATVSRLGGGRRPDTAGHSALGLIGLLLMTTHDFALSQPTVDHRRCRSLASQRESAPVATSAGPHSSP